MVIPAVTVAPVESVADIHNSMRSGFYCPPAYPACRGVEGRTVWQPLEQQIRQGARRQPSDDRKIDRTQIERRPCLN